MNPNVKATASYIPGTTAWTMVVFEAADVPVGTKVQPVTGQEPIYMAKSPEEPDGWMDLDKETYDHALSIGFECRIVFAASVQPNNGIPPWTDEKKTELAAVLAKYAPKQPANVEKVRELRDAVDAERYRYLRDVHIGDDPVSINIEANGKGMDYAIDALLAAAKKGSIE